MIDSVNVRMKTSKKCTIQLRVDILVTPNIKRQNIFYKQPRISWCIFLTAVGNHRSRLEKKVISEKIKKAIKKAIMRNVNTVFLNM